MVKSFLVTKTTVRSHVHQTLDVHRGLATKVAFHGVVGVDRLTDVQDFLVGQVLDTPLRRDLQLFGDFLGLGATNAVDVGKRDFDALVRRDVDPSDTCHKNKVLPAPRGHVAGGPIS